MKQENQRHRAKDFSKKRNGLFLAILVSFVFGSNIFLGTAPVEASVFSDVGGHFLVGASVFGNVLEKIEQGANKELENVVGNFTEGQEAVTDYLAGYFLDASATAVEKGASPQKIVSNFEVNQFLKQLGNGIKSGAIEASDAFFGGIGNLGYSVKEIGQQSVGVLDNAVGGMTGGMKETGRTLEKASQSFIGGTKEAAKNLEKAGAMFINSTKDLGKTAAGVLENIGQKVINILPFGEKTIAPVLVEQSKSLQPSAGESTEKSTKEEKVSLPTPKTLPVKTQPVIIYSNPANKASVQQLQTSSGASLSKNPTFETIKSLGSLFVGNDITIDAATGIATLKGLKVEGEVDFSKATVKGLQQTIVNNYSNGPPMVVYNTTTKENESWQTMTGQIGGVSEHFSVGKDLTVSRNATVASILTIGSTTANGSLTVNGSASITGAASVTGALTLASNATIAGDLTVNGNTTLGDVAGDTITVNGRLSTLNISDGSTTSSISKNSFYLGDTANNSRGVFYVDSSGNTAVSGTVNLSNTTLAVVSSTAANLRIAADGSNQLELWTNATKRMFINSSGNTFASGTLQVTNTSTLYNDLLVGASTESITDPTFVFTGNDVYLEDKLGVNGMSYLEGAILASSTLQVTNTSTLYNDLLVGASSPAAAVTNMGFVFTGNDIYGHDSLGVNGKSYFNGNIQATSSLLIGSAALADRFYVNGAAYNSYFATTTWNGGTAGLVNLDADTSGGRGLVIRADNSATNYPLVIEASSNGNRNFYVDGSGNTFASGTLQVTNTSTLYNDLLLGVNAPGHLTGTNNLYVQGQSEHDGTAWFDGRLQASSTLLVGTAAGTDNLFVSGNNTYIATSSPASSAYSLLVAKGTTGALAVGGLINPLYNNLLDLGAYGNAWQHTYASGTVYSADIYIADSSANTPQLTVYDQTTASTTLLRVSTISLGQGTNYGSGIFNVDSLGNVSASGTLTTFGNTTLGGHLYPSTDNLYDIGSSSTQWRYGNFQGGLLVANGSTTSTLFNNSFISGETSGYNLGKFYVDSSGNVSASGSLYTYGNVTSTGILYATNGLISSASSTFASNLQITGNVRASSTLLVGTGAGADNFYVSGNNSYFATTSWGGGTVGLLNIDADTSGGRGLVIRSDNTTTNIPFVIEGSSLASSTLLSESSLIIGKGNNYNLGAFYVDSNGNTSASGTLTTFGNTTLGGHLYPSTDNLYDIGSSSTQWRYGNFQGGLLVADGSNTSTLTKNSLILTQGTSDNLGKFYVDLNGNVSASGSLYTYGNVTSTGILYATNGLISSASSTFTNNLWITGNASVTGTLQSTGAFTAYGNTTLGDSVSDSIAINGVLGTINISDNTNSTTTLTRNSLSLGITSTKTGTGVFYVDLSGNVFASGTLQTAGNFTSGGHLYPSTDNLYDIGSSSTQWRYGNFQGGILVADGTNTSTLANTSLIIGQESTDNLGAFYVDLNGNVSASGSLYTFGNVTSTGILYATNGLISSASSTFSSNLFIAGNANVTGTLQSTGIFTTYGNSVFGDTVADTITINGVLGTINISDNTNSTTTLTRNSLSLGITSTKTGTGVFYVDLSGNVFASGTLQTAGNFTSGGHLYPSTVNLYDIGASSTQWRYLNLQGGLLVADGSNTSTLTKNSLILTQGTSDNLGKFYVDSSGNVSASGSLYAFGNVTSTGILYATNGLISSASSTFTSNLQITGNARASSTLLVGTAAGNNFFVNGTATTVSTTLNVVTSGSASTTVMQGDSLILGQGSTNYNKGMFYVDSSGNVSASGTLTVWASQTASSSILNGTLTLGKGTNYNQGMFYVDTNGNVSASGTLAIRGVSDGSVTSTMSTSFNVGSDSFIYDASSTITYITSLQTGGLNFPDDAGIINWVNLQITTTTASIVNSYSASINEYPVLTVYGLSNTAGTASNLGLMVASSSAPWTDFSVNNLFTVASSTGNTNVSGTLRVWGSSATSGLQISATQSTTTFTSYVGNSIGSTAFVFNSNTAITSGTDRMLAVFQSGGANQFLISSGGNVYAAESFIANSSDYGISDVAEYVNIVPGESVEAGDVVIADMSGINKYKKSSESYAKNVAGVISDTGAFVMGASGENRAALALAGLVKVKVTDENGPIQVGDYLVTASQPGYAMKYNPDQGKPAGLVGMALEPLISGQGKILLMINKGYVDGASQSVTNLTVNQNSSGQLVQNGDLNMAGYSILNVKSISGTNDKWMIDENGKMMVQEVKTGKLKVQKDVEPTKSTIGEAVIKLNTSQILVENENVDQKTKIFITFRNNPKAFWWISKQIDGQFEVSLSQAASEDVVFDYWLIGVEDSADKNADSADVPAAAPEPVPTVEPALVTEPASADLPAEASAQAGATAGTPTPTEQPAPSEPASEPAPAESTPPAEPTPPAE